MNSKYLDVTIENIKIILETKVWKFASSMKNIPHSYTLERNWDSPEEFKKVVDFINENGYKEKFFNRTYTYLVLNGYKYWAMKISDGTGIINRAKIK